MTSDRSGSGLGTETACYVAARCSMHIPSANRPRLWRVCRRPLPSSFHPTHTHGTRRPRRGVFYKRLDGGCLAPPNVWNRVRGREGGHSEFPAAPDTCSGRRRRYVCVTDVPLGARLGEGWTSESVISPSLVSGRRTRCLLCPFRPNARVYTCLLDYHRYTFARNPSCTRRRSDVTSRGLSLSGSFVRGCCGVDLVAGTARDARFQHRFGPTLCIVLPRPVGSVGCQGLDHDA